MIPKMYLNMITPLEHIETYIKNSILDEIKEDGLLSDIKSTKTTFKDFKITEVPSVWIYLGDWTIEEEAVNRNNSRATLVYNVEISVICNKPDVYESDSQATSIQARIVESVIKNWKRVINKDMNLQNLSINFQTGYNDGRLTVVNKQQKVVIKGVILQFKFLLDWIRCIEKQNIINDEEEQTNNNNGG